MKVLRAFPLILLILCPGCGSNRDSFVLEYFYSTHCPSCDRVLEKLERADSRRIRVHAVNVLVDNGLDIFLSRLDEAGLSVHPGSLPVLFIGNDIYRGAEEILAVLSGLQGGTRSGSRP